MSTTAGLNTKPQIEHLNHLKRRLHSVHNSLSTLVKCYVSLSLTTQSAEYEYEEEVLVLRYRHYKKDIASVKQNLGIMNGMMARPEGLKG